MTILGELPISDGIVSLRDGAKIVYAEQDPLIVTGSVKDNILFGLPMDHDWYNKVVQSCSLDHDFNQMPSKDETMLGEMGHNLSGGQKSRISLARALYRKDADLILIDASLSTLDSKTSKTIMLKVV